MCNRVCFYRPEVSTRSLVKFPEWSALRSIEAIILAERNQEIKLLREQCTQLTKQNQGLYEVLSEAQHNYEWMSDLHDKAAAENSSAQRAQEAQQRRHASVFKSLHSSTSPALAKVEEWLCKHQTEVSIGQRLEIPVLCLRWTHASIHSKMMFGHGGHEASSIFQLVDELQRGSKEPSDILECLDVAPHDGKFFCLSNRRLTALSMHQALHRDCMVKAWCRIVSSDTQKFKDANTTQNEGFGIGTRDGESQHFGAPLFNRGAYVVHELEQLAGRHVDEDLSGLMERLRLRPSEKEFDAQSLTISELSQTPLPAKTLGKRPK